MMNCANSDHPGPSRRELLAGGVAASAAGALAGCAAPPKGQLVMLAANVAKSIGSLDFYVAQAAGFLKAEKLDIAVRYAANASQAAQILATGNADLGRFAFDPALLGWARGIHLKAFYQFYRHSIFYLGIPQASPIKTLQDLRGKTVAVTNMGSAAVGVLRSMLQRAGLPAASVTFQPVSSVSTAITARRSGRVDAYMLYNEMYASMLGAGEDLRFVHDTGYGDLGGNAYFAQAASFQAKAEALGRFARAIAKASVFILANVEAAAAIYLDVNPDAGSARSAADLAKTADEIRFWSQDWKIDDAHPLYGRIDLNNLARYADMLKAQGTLKLVPPVASLATNQLIVPANRFDPNAVRQLAAGWPAPGRAKS